MSRADFDLVRAALRREPWAVTEIGERMLCLPRFVRLIGRKLHVRIDEEEVTEISGSSFLIVWSKLSEFRGESRLESWAYRIVRWEIANALRRRDRAPKDSGRARSTRRKRAQ